MIIGLITFKRSPPPSRSPTCLNAAQLGVEHASSLARAAQHSMAGAVKWWLCPKGEFGDRAAPPAPDYNRIDDVHWLAWPGAVWSRAAEQRPLGEDDDADGAAADADDADDAAARPVDCFYLLPTCFGIAANPTGRWNAPLVGRGALSSNRIAQFNLATQAGAFNRRCRVYSPNYRQMVAADAGVRRLSALAMASTLPSVCVPDAIAKAGNSFLPFTYFAAACSRLLVQCR